MSVVETLPHVSLLNGLCFRFVTFSPVAKMHQMCKVSATRAFDLLK